MGERISGLYAEPCGVDFSAAVLSGLRSRIGPAPEALARVTLIVSNPLMRKGILQQLRQASATFFPKIVLTTELATLLPEVKQLEPQSTLIQELELAQALRTLLSARPDLAPSAAAFDLAVTLRLLLGEMIEEGVSFDALEQLDTADLAHHWQQSLSFLKLIARYLDADTTVTQELVTAETVAALSRKWQAHPPQNPVLLVGSTGSRGPVLSLISQVMALPQGAVILPGHDPHLPAAVWKRLEEARPKTSLDDHPQAPLARVARALSVEASNLPRWDRAAPQTTPRSRLISLALRPAPVTDAWRTEAPAILEEVPEAYAGLTLIEAETPREEAAAIAVVLRDAVAEGKEAALISPDRQLVRQVTAALDRWRIIPDDSAGRPFTFSAPGRLMRLVADARGQELLTETLLILLKHPLTSAAHERGPHLLLTRHLERHALRGRVAMPKPADIAKWAKAHPEQPMAWADWVSELIERLTQPVSDAPIADHHRNLTTCLAHLCGGPKEATLMPLLEQSAGQVAGLMLDELSDTGTTGGDLSAADFAALIQTLASRREVREDARAHTQVRILPTLEARVGLVDRMVLAGLNEGTWPQPLPPDPWLSRGMRQSLGLRAPEREIGLTAHNFQQAMAGPEVILTRAKRDDEAETVPTRWLNRMTNLTKGLGPLGKREWEDMRARGAKWLTYARALEKPDGASRPAPRPAPTPPVDARPKVFSVTEIETLIRDPYAIYAKKVLRLRALDPVRQTPDARLRGTLLHAALERFTDETREALPANAEEVLSHVLEATLRETVPWPAQRSLWHTRLAALIPWFISRERLRRAHGTPCLIETSGSIPLGQTSFTLMARADRVDLQQDGRVALYDYKTGKAPSPKQREHFNKQLPLEALIIAEGGYGALGPREVAHMAYLSFSSGGEETSLPTGPDEIKLHLDGLLKLLTAYDDPAQGYAARRAVIDRPYPGDYDHLARYGEWDNTAEATHIEVGS